MPGLRRRADPVWLLDYDVGGHIFRYATHPVDVVDVAGNTLTYAPGLSEVTSTATYTLGTRSLGLEILSGVDWALQVARGIDLDDRPATVRLWFSPDVLEATAVTIKGTSEGVVWRQKQEPLQVKVETDATKDGLVMPGPQAMASDVTWPVRVGYDFPKASEGVTYPVVFGYPGTHDRSGTNTPEPAGPAVPVEINTTGGYSGTSNRHVVSVGVLDAVQAELWEASGEVLTSSSETVSTTTDALGQTVSYIQKNGPAAVTDSKFYVGFKATSGWGGGIKSPYDGGVLRDADQVARFVLDTYTEMDLDKDRWRATGGLLSRFKIDAVLSSRVNAAKWLTTQVLPLLPAIGVQGEGGFYLAPLRWDATSLDAIAWLDADRGHVSMSGGLSLWREPIHNLFSLDYRISGRDKKPASRRTLSSISGNLFQAIMSGANIPPFGTAAGSWLDAIENDTRIYGSAVCRWSQAKYGIKEKQLSSAVIWDDATASQILHHMALKHAWRKRMARYVGGLELHSLNPGDIVTITDARVHLSAAVCMVAERTTSVGEVALDLLILDHPLQVTRTTT